MVVAVDVDVRVLVDRLDKLRSNQLPRAVGTALSRSGRTVRARVQRAIREDLNTTAGNISRALTLERSNAVDGAGRASIELRARGKPLPLGGFAPKMTPAGATFQYLRGGPRKAAKSGGNTGFLVGKRVGRRERKSGGLTKGRFVPNPAYGKNIFVRRDDGGLRRLYGPGVSIRVAGRRMRNIARDAFRERFALEFRAVLGEFIRRAESGRTA